jgi:hypothetical protein
MYASFPCFVERLIGTVRREYSIGPYFGTKAILSGSSRITKPITTNIGATAGWLCYARSTERCPHRQWQNLNIFLAAHCAYFDPNCRLNWNSTQIPAVSAGVPTFELGRMIYGTTVEPNHPNRPKIAVAQFDRFHQTKDLSGPTANLAALRAAACFSHHLEELFEIFERDSMSHHRLSSGIDALRTGFSARLAHTRLHQFVRAIEACLPAERVWGASDFADYAATFLSRPEQEALLQMYQLRNDAEHHRRFDLRSLRDVADPEAVAMRRTRQAEVFARELYRRFLGTEVNHLPVFQSDDTLEEFWSDKDRVRKTWGSPLDLSSIS